MDVTKSQSWSPAILNHVKEIAAETSQLDKIEGKNIESDDEAAYRLLQYLGSDEADAMAPVVLDASHPISDYFISSSHNTYLWGNQLYGKASTKAYQKVLERGCRCVEIDVWDGHDPDSDTSDSSADSDSDSDSDSDAENEGEIKKLSRRFKKKIGLAKSKPETRSTDKQASASSPSKHENEASAGLRRTVSKTEPRVLHGHTATKEISFRAVCATIRDYAFATSDLPLIVSLEVHTCPAQQQIMVDIIRDLWAPYLVELNAVTGHEITLPTLESLRKKILIKVKYTAPEIAARKTGPAIMSSNAEPESGSEDESREAQEAPVKKSHIITALAAMGVYTRGCHFKDFDQPEAKLPNHVFSLSESKIIEVHRRDHSALFRHNKRFFMRVYPKGIRVSSSNLDPAPFWRMGAQVVALNWQYINAATMLNQAMFHGTGGWVLKPDGYRSCHRAQSQITALDRGKLDLTIELLAGQDIGPSEGKLRLYVRSELHIEDMEEINGGSLPEGGSTKEGQIKAVTELGTAGRSPDFRRQLLQFKVDGVAEELTFVRFKIMDDDTFSRDNLVAWACFKLSRLQTGIRKIRLYDCEGQQTNGMLLVRISKKHEIE